MIEPNEITLTNVYIQVLKFLTETMTKLRVKSKSSLKIVLRIFHGKFPLENILVILITLSLFISSLYIKNLIGTWIFESVGWDYNFTFYYPSGVKEVWFFEIYKDSESYYMPFLEAFRYEGWNPYVRSEGYLDYYVYGPMFIYGLYLVSLIIGVINPGASSDLVVQESVKWFAIVFDSLSVVLLYLIIKDLKTFKERRLAKHIYGILGAISLLFMPMCLFYIDAYHLNTPQMTFFTLIAIWMFLKEKYKFSAILLSLGWLSKQVPLFLIIPLFFIIRQKKGISFALKKFILPFVVWSFLFSIPWILITPHLYIGRLIGVGRPLWYAALGGDAIKHGVTLANTFLYLGSTTLTNFYIVINIAMIPFFLSYILAILISSFNGKKIGENETIFSLYITWLIVLIHVFMSRGIFKYYDTFITPFLVLSSLLLIDEAIRKIPKLRNKNHLKGIKSEGEEKNKGYIVLNNLTSFGREFFFLTSFLSSILVIYYLNWIIMIESRFLHPLFLLLLLLSISLLLPFEFYKSMFKRVNYQILKKDLCEIFRLIKNKCKKIYKKFRLKLLKKRKEK